ALAIVRIRGCPYSCSCPRGPAPGSRPPGLPPHSPSPGVAVPVGLPRRRIAMQDVARIVLAVESEHLAQDVIDFLDRTGRTRVVDTVRDTRALAEVLDRERPDAVVGSPEVVRS